MPQKLAAERKKTRSSVSCADAIVAPGKLCPPAASIPALNTLTDLSSNGPKTPSSIVHVASSTRGPPTTKVVATKIQLLAHIVVNINTSRLTTIKAPPIGASVSAAQQHPLAP
ncbi:hypothetical protein DPSP01_014244 [Paraphaeosphaeria sporulosa]